MGEEEKKEVFQCQVCGRTHRRAEGKCFCGADLQIFGKWVAAPEPLVGPHIDPDVIKKHDEEMKERREEELKKKQEEELKKKREKEKIDKRAKEDPVIMKDHEKTDDLEIRKPKKPGRKLAKIAATLGFIIVFALVSVMVSEWLDTGEDRRTVSREEGESTSGGGGEDPADASGDTLDDEESEIPQDTPEESDHPGDTQEEPESEDLKDTPDPDGSEPDPTITGTPEESEESGADISLAGMICNETENAVYSVFMFSKNSDEVYDMLGSENILVDGSRQDIMVSVSEEKNYNLMVLNDTGEVFGFMDVAFGENDGLTLSERAGVPLLTVTKADGNLIFREGETRQLRDLTSEFAWMRVPLCNDTRYDFSELYIYDSGTEDRGSNLIEFWLEDDILNPYDNFKFIAEWDTPKDVYFLDTEGDIWLYENVDFSGAFCIYNRLNEEGQPELVLVYSDPIDSEDDFMVVSGGLWEG